MLTGGVCASAAEPIAKIQGLLINADTMDRDTEQETVDLSGKVQIVNKDQHISADTARIRLRARQVELNGNVRVVTNRTTIGGRRMLLDYESGTGVIYDGFVQSGNVLFEGAVLQKTGPDEYYVQSAGYTACTNCPPSWSFSGSSIRAELGGYAYIKSSWLKVGWLPVVWLPYLVVPLKSDRQTGLLTPEFETSLSGGLAVTQNVFWVIDRSTDATLGVRHYEKRGLKGLLNYRQVFSERAAAELDVAAIRDRVFEDDQRLKSFRATDQQDQPVNRWFARYGHYLEMPGDWVHRAWINNASDLQYPKDFPLETLNHGDSSMENRISFTKNTDDRHFNAEASYHINLLQGNPNGSNEEAVHRIPEITWSQMPKPLGSSGFLYTIDLNYSNFTRSGPAYDDLTLSNEQASGGRTGRFINSTCAAPRPGDPAGVAGDRVAGTTADEYGSNPLCRRRFDGTYDPSVDLIRTGQRFDFQPTLSRPMTFADAFDVVPSIGYRETHYSFNVGPEPTNIRRYVRTELSGRSTFSRVFGDMSPRGVRYKHEIKPELTYTVLPWIDHRSHPFFGFAQQTEAPSYTGYIVNDTDLAGNFGLQFDFTDRIYDRNLLTYSVSNVLTEKRWSGDSAVYKQLALLKVSQSYDAFQDSRNDQNKQPWSDISADLTVNLNRVQTFSRVQYFPYQKVTNGAGYVRVLDSVGRFVELKVAKRFIIVPGQDVDPDTRTEDYGLGAGLISRYLDVLGKFTYDSNLANPNRIKSVTSITQFKPPGDCWLVTFIFNKVTGGEEQLKFNFTFNFDGLPKPPIPPEALNAYGF